MIHNLDPLCYYSNRNYLTQWFYNDVMVIVDNETLPLRNELYRERGNQTESNRLQQLIDQHPVRQHVIDVTHNVFPTHILQTDPARPILTNEVKYYYQPEAGVIFFPLFLWMYSLRNSLWWELFCFDQGTDKTQALMCLNNRPRPHRTQVWAEFNRRGIIDQCVFSFTEPVDYEKNLYSYSYPLTLENEKFDLNRNDIGVGHQVYKNCAVNLVTETVTDLPYVSEKTCKPFIARQIPILVGSIKINQFLTDIGLDMFADVVPWTSWDSEPNDTLRINKIVDFVESWLRSGSILSDYKKLLPRIERNKQYFHSEQFRNRILNQMPS